MRRSGAGRGSSPLSNFHKLSFRQVSCAEETMRLKDKIAIIVGAGQSPGEGMGNGRATVLRFTQEGAKVLAVDNNLASAEETVAIVRQDARERAAGTAAGADCVAFQADVSKEATLAAMVEEALRRWGRMHGLHYN